MTIRFLLAGAATLLVTVPAVAAAIITPVAVSASNTFSFFGQYKASNLIDGSGLSGGLHDANFASMWMTDLGVNQATLVFDLGAAFKLEGASIWTYNFGDPNIFQSSILRGVKDFTLSVSQDGETYAEALAARLELGTGQPLAAETFAFAATGRFVRLDILTNYGQGTYAERDWNSGLSEVRFAGAAVPEPATWAMMVGGFGLVGAALRRRATRPDAA